MSVEDVERQKKEDEPRAERSNGDWGESDREERRSQGIKLGDLSTPGLRGVDWLFA